MGDEEPDRNIHFHQLKKKKKLSQEPLADIHFHLIKTERGAMTVS